MRRKVGFLLCLSAMWLMVVSGSDWQLGNVSLFLNLPTLIYNCMILTGVILYTSGFKTFIAGLNGVFSKNYHMTDELRAEATDLFILLRKTVTLAGVALTCISLCLLLLYLDDPSAIGPNVAVALLALLYAAFINMALINPILYLLQHRKDAEPAKVARIKEKAAVDKLLQLCFEKGITLEEVMESDEIELRKKNN